MNRFTRESLKINYFLRSHDAVAEVMDFITIVGILMLSFSIIGVAGYPVLKSAQETRYTENTRLSFIVLAENINKIALGQAPSQSVELKMYGGRLNVAGESTIEINATNSTHDVIQYFDQMGSIQNSIGDTVVTYEGTAVWVKYPNGVILNAYKPLITNQSNVLIIPVVSIGGNYSTGGTGMGRIRAEGEPGVTLWSNVSNVTVTITGDYVSGWKDYFKNIMKWYVPDSGGYTARLNATNLDVYILKIDMYTEIE